MVPGIRYAGPITWWYLVLVPSTVVTIPGTQQDDQMILLSPPSGLIGPKGCHAREFVSGTRMILVPPGTRYDYRRPYIYVLL